MPRPKDQVRVSSKGQIVLPADLRKALGLTSGRQLRLERSAKSIILTPLEPTADSVPEALQRIRGAAKRLGRDGVAALHQRRSQERRRDARRP